MNDATYCQKTKPHMEALAAALTARLHRDQCGDYCVEGRRGNIHADGTGYSIAVLCPTARGWNVAKGKLAAFCRVTQDGDTEGVLHMPTLPIAEHAALLRDTLRIRKIKELSEETIEAIKARTAAYRFKASATAPVPNDAEQEAAWDVYNGGNTADPILCASEQTEAAR